METGHLPLLAQILVGFVLLFFGRKLFWLFVGLIGFVAGMNLGGHLLAGQPEWMVFAVAVGIGILGAILAVLLERIAVALAGGVAGGMIAMRFAEMAGMNSDGALGIAFVLGLIVGAILVLALLDWALIVLSSLLGANLLAESIDLQRGPEAAVLLVLIVLGIVVQGRQLAGKRVAG